MSAYTSWWCHPQISFLLKPVTKVAFHTDTHTSHTTDLSTASSSLSIISLCIKFYKLVQNMYQNVISEHPQFLHTTFYVRQEQFLLFEMLFSTILTVTLYESLNCITFSHEISLHGPYRDRIDSSPPIADFRMLFYVIHICILSKVNSIAVFELLRLRILPCSSSAKKLSCAKRFLALIFESDCFKRACKTGLLHSVLPTSLFSSLFEARLKLLLAGLALHNNWKCRTFWRKWRNIMLSTPWYIQW